MRTHCVVDGGHLIPRYFVIEKEGDIQEAVAIMKKQGAVLFTLFHTISGQRVQLPGIGDLEDGEQLTRAEEQMLTSNSEDPIAMRECTQLF